MLDGRLQTRRIYRVSQARLGRACSTTLCTMPAWRMIMVWSGKELFVRARLTQRTVDTVSSPPQEGSERRFLGKENLYQRKNLMVWFWIFASLTLSSFWPHNGQECEVWQNLVDSFLNLLGLLLLSQGWTYLKLLYELSTETKLGSLEWAPKRLLPNISLSYLYFCTIALTFSTVYNCNSLLLYFYFSLGMERLVENMGKALERVCRRMEGGHIHIHNIMASCDAPALIVFCLWSSVLCSHSKSGYNSIPFSLHSYLFKISPATFTKKDVHSHRKVYSYTNHFPTLDAHAMMLSS